jgi:ribosomal protein S12 methylthiotransferase accessory factor YcaO
MLELRERPSAALVAEVVEDCEIRYFAEFDLWAAVARGRDPRRVGAAFDFALGLGIGSSDAIAEARALGECLERYGASIAGVGAPATAPVWNEEGMYSGEAPSAAVFLPWIGPAGPALPCGSEGLAFAPRFAVAARRAALEMIERQALRRAIEGRGGFLSRGEAQLGPLTASLLLIPAEVPVILALIEQSGRLAACGAAAAATESEAVEKALQEAALAWLCADGAILPGVFEGRETLLARHDVHRAGDLALRSGASTAPRTAVVFADAAPAGWAAEGGCIVRALPAAVVIS